MKYRIIRETEQKVSKWAGGTTTELFIYPENALYTERNFSFRISTATVEAESSIFTRLPGFSRILMILKGKIEIQHQGKYRKILRKFEQDSFEGSWETSSQGKAVDFNLMTAEGVSGSVKAITLKAENEINFDFSESGRFTGIYVFTGIVKVSLNDETAFLEGGDFLMIEGFQQGSMGVVAEKNAEIIISSIQTTDNVPHPSPSPDMPFVPGRST